MSCGIWQSILSCTEFSEWYPKSSVHMWTQDVLARWTEWVSHCTCPCPHCTAEIKALLFMEGGTADGRNLHKSCRKPRGFSSGGSFRGYSMCRRQSLKGKRSKCVSLPEFTHWVWASVWSKMISLRWSSWRVPLYREQSILHLPFVTLEISSDPFQMYYSPYVFECCTNQVQVPK